MILQSLNRDEGWKQFYDEKVRSKSAAQPKNLTVARQPATYTRACDDSIAYVSVLSPSARHRRLRGASREGWSQQDVIKLVDEVLLVPENASCAQVVLGDPRHS